MTAIGLATIRYVGLASIRCVADIDLKHAINNADGKAAQIAALPSLRDFAVIQSERGQMTRTMQPSFRDVTETQISLLMRTSPLTSVQSSTIVEHD